MLEYAVQIGNETDVSNRIYVMRRPNVPSPEYRFTEKTIPGRDGTILIDEGSIEDIEFEIEFNFLGKPDEWFSIFRQAKKWLLQKGERELKFFDDPFFFYVIKKVTIETAERVCYEIGRFTAKFICKGTQFYDSGKEAFDYLTLQENPGIESHPIYMISGSGICTLTVNGNSVKANVSQNLTIDTERMIAYREDGTFVNTSISGDYEDLYLQPGENTVSVTSGFDCKIIPNWRCL